MTGAVINGNVLGGTGTDTLGLSGAGSGSFNVAQLDLFEAGEKTGSGSWTLTGANAGIGTFAVNGGTLVVNGSLATSSADRQRRRHARRHRHGRQHQVIAGGTFAPGTARPARR